MRSLRRDRVSVEGKPDYIEYVYIYLKIFQRENRFLSPIVGTSSFASSRIGERDAMEIAGIVRTAFAMLPW